MPRPPMAGRAPPYQDTDRRVTARRSAAPVQTRLFTPVASFAGSALHNTAVPAITAVRGCNSAPFSDMRLPPGVALDFPPGVFVRFGTQSRRVGYRVAENGCWLWRGSLDPDGYGQAFNHRLGRVDKAHRVVWEHYYGPLPRRGGAELDHTCRSRACVNPQHLELVTHRENRRRAVRCARHVYQYSPGRKPRCRYCGRRKPGPRTAR